MKNYTDINFKSLFSFLLLKWKLIIVISTIIGIMISLSYFLSYNTLETYFPNAMTKTSIINKIKRINEEITYYENILDENQKYRENSIYYSYIDNEAFLYNVEFHLDKSDNHKMNDIVLDLSSNQFYETVSNQLKLNSDSKYIKELFSFTANTGFLTINISLEKSKNIDIYMNIITNYLKTKWNISDNYQIKKISKSIITKDILSDYYLGFKESDYANKASIKNSEDELQLYEKYLLQVEKKLDIYDYMRIATFSIVYVMIVNLIIMVLLFIKNTTPISKEEYISQGISFYNGKIRKNEVIKLNSFNLILLYFRIVDFKDRKSIIISPGILASKLLISFYKKNANLNFIYFEDILYEK